MSQITKELREVQQLAKSVGELKESFDSYASQPVYKSGMTANKLYAVPRDKRVEDKCGFKSFSEYLVANKAASRPQSEADYKALDRIQKSVTKAASGLNENVESEGGFLVPPTFANTIFQRVYENDIMSRCDVYSITGRTMKFPAIDETSRVDGSRHGGVRAYWADEGGQGTASKPKYRQVSLTLNKLMCLGYITEELSEDAGTAMEQYLTKAFADEIDFKVGDSIINGDGAAKPQGILNSQCLVTVAKEAGQSATTIVTENILKMWRRMWGKSRTNAVWFINQDTESALYTMSLGVGTGGLPVFMPPGGLSGQPYATMLGRPVVPIEFCATLGTVGDIILADMTQYIVANKGGVNTATSIHLRFDYDEQAFRATFRLDGKPWWHSALTPYKGSNTQSPFIALATRA